MRALFDTSVFVAQETGRPVETPEGVDEGVVSVVTVAELTTGVLQAADEHRATRLATLTTVESSWDPLPVDVDVARRFGELVADLRRRGRKVPILDGLIAATAMAQGI